MLCSDNVSSGKLSSQNVLLKEITFSKNILKMFIDNIIRGGTVHVFVPNRHGTDLSVRCMRPYDEYRQFTPNPEGGAAAMQHCLITASRRTANAMSCALENKAP